MRQLPLSVLLALIAGVKPAVLQHARCFFRAIPVAGKDVRAAHDDLFLIADMHFDAVDGRPDMSGLGRARADRPSCRCRWFR